MAQRTKARPTPRTHQTISGASWESRTLERQTHTGVAFLDLDMTEVVDEASVFTDCSFRRTRFNCSKHTDAAFINCTFANCNFFEARFTGCKFVGCLFERCEYDLMVVAGGNWSHAGLPSADLRKAEFTDVRMSEADLTGANLQGAVLRGCDLSGSWLHGANFSRCDLRGSDISAIDPVHARLAGTIIDFQQAAVLASAMGLEVRSE